MTTANAERDVALAALAARIRTEAEQGGGQAVARLERMEIATDHIGSHDRLRQLASEGTTIPKPSEPVAPAAGNPRLRPVSDFLEPQHKPQDKWKEENEKREAQLAWPYARETAAPDEAHDPQRDQREVRILVTGGRRPTSTAQLEELLDATVDRTDGAPVRIITGERGGVERLTCEWAEKRDLPIDVYPIDWEAGKGAGYRRNESVLVEANPDLVLMVERSPDRMSRHLAELAQQSGVRVEAPVSSRLTRSPDGLQANLAAVARTPTRVQTEAETQGSDNRAGTVPVRPVRAVPSPLATSPPLSVDVGR